MPAGGDQPQNLPIPRPRPGLLWIAVLAVLAVAAIWRLTPSLIAFAPAGAGIGGPFTLTDPQGRRVTEANLAGKPFAIFFGYTHCPDVCPTTLSDMTDWLKALGSDADRLRMVFVTVDPARDTPATLADYMKAFDPRILALTGSEDDVSKTLLAYRVYAKKVEVKGSDYAMDHTAAVYLMDNAGKLHTLIGFGEKPDAALAKVKELIGAS
jgi:protein SCO1/2